MSIDTKSFIHPAAAIVVEAEWKEIRKLDIGFAKAIDLLKARADRDLVDQATALRVVMEHVSVESSPAALYKRQQAGEAARERRERRFKEGSRRVETIIDERAAREARDVAKAEAVRAAQALEAVRVRLDADPDDVVKAEGAAIATANRLEGAEARLAKAGVPTPGVGRRWRP